MIENLIRRHEALRAAGLNLVASENRPSSRVRAALASDLAGRYHSGHYGGGGVAEEIVRETEGLARRLFRARHAIVTPLSGNLCDLAALLAFTSPGDAVAMLPFTSGGYPLALERLERRRVSLPVHPGTLDIDVEASARLLRDEEAKLLILGASFFPFPQPVRELSQALEEAGHGGTCVYDASHVLGLIACGEFQDPLREGAEVLIGSTHKSFFGPQGGVILTDSDAAASSLKEVCELDLATGPVLVDNPHPNRVAALGLACEEMLADPGYGRRVVENSRTLAGALNERGVPVRFRDRGFTSSHQVLLDLGPEESAGLCRRLEEVGVFIDFWGRIGTSEATHRGLGVEEMEEAGDIVARVYTKGPSAEIERRVKALLEKELDI